MPTSDFTSQPDWSADEAGLRQRLSGARGVRVEFVDVAALAQQLLGDAILCNMLLLGYAWQKGVIPVRRAAMEKAIELNGVATGTNHKAFALGRWLAHDPAAVRRLLAPAQVVQFPKRADGPLGELIEDRARRLVDYQNAALATRYRARIEAVRRMLAGRSDAQALLREVAAQYYRVLAVKDEYEVARLYSRPAFMQSLRDAFDGDFKVSFHLAGGPFGKLDKVTGKIGKTAVGAWIRPAFRLLAGARFLRGHRLDPFARGAEAVLNRRVLAAYEADLDLLGQAAAQWPAERLQALLGWPACAVTATCANGRRRRALPYGTGHATSGAAMPAGSDNGIRAMSYAGRRRAAQSIGLAIWTAAVATRQQTPSGSQCQKRSAREDLLCNLHSFFWAEGIQVPPTSVYFAPRGGAVGSSSGS
ncbi:Pyruvate ferredoxin/flavodoxin oxidoreductase (modular protein) [Cupriavidus necator]|uniref:Pyruvate ferredoxin/flavodoxin oxidoreductase (Modular protein) n=1 Tax=Cupriavidus necator TaxID=106590 RepID=A0A1K0IMB7_CUPNE|nr:Pyruvate ferredoxin/flavodoxin oxidoreductase (modular protein) [Cupriavidus necator]